MIRKHDKKRSVVLMFLVVALAMLSVVQYIELSQTRSALSEIREELSVVTGVIVSLKRVEYEDSGEVRYIGLLRLTSDDRVNGVEAGEISDYIIVLDSYRELDVGNLVVGIPLKDEAPSLKVRSVIPFIISPIINTGDYVDFEVVKLNTGVGSSYSSLYLGLNNLGEKEIISIRVEINGTIIPFFFGVNKEHPVKPSKSMHKTVPTSWFDPALNGTAGFRPERGETYPVVVTLTLTDGTLTYSGKTVKTWNFSVTAISYGAIVTLIDTGSHIEIQSVDLFENRKKEDFLSVVFRNVWKKTVTNVTILVDDTIVAKARTNLKTGGSWVASMRLPFNVYLSSSHNVTIQTRTADGDIAEVSQVVKSEKI